MIDLETIEYYEYMKEREEQEELEDKIFYKIMDLHLEEESRKILEDIKRRKENGEDTETSQEEARKKISELWEIAKSKKE